MDTIFVIFGFILLCQSMLAFGAVIRFARYASRPHSSSQNRYQPKAFVIVPCKGLEHDFEENIHAFFTQEYRDYELIFVTESESDPAYGALTQLVKQSRRAAWLVVAGEAKGMGQKIHNLLAAIEMLNSIDRRAEVLVFADTDTRVSRYWLTELIAPLGDKRIGATTGFRWYLPTHSMDAGESGWLDKLTSILLSVWNASALSLLNEKSSFAWGGGMAIRRDNFDKLGIKRRWQGAVSDDYVLTAAVQEAGQRIKFAPRALNPSFSDVTLQELIEFTTRQFVITRVYAPRVWRLAALTHGIYFIALWGGLIWLVAQSLKGEVNYSLLSLLIGVLALGAMSGWARSVVAGKLLFTKHDRVRRYWWAYTLFAPVVSFIYLYKMIA
jgi:cellulose synthase/poly-beta-1,6-N-acetylglucosamine synthase-like glycosyltransferase